MENDGGKKLRRIVGMTLFIAGCIAPFFAPLAFYIGLPEGWAIGLAAALVLGLPEVLWIIAGLIMGREAIAALKERGKFWKKRE
jgi:hypothetical protein